jgi:hypothetical protein
MENVPCETQPAIKNLDTPAGSPPTPVAASKSAASTALASSVSRIFDAELNQILKNQHSKLRVVGTPATSSKSSGSKP